jgi:uncharacterized protein
MKKRALILHCWYGSSNDNWYLWLKTELEKKGYQVTVPELPTMKTNLPDMELQLKTVEELIDENTIIIGHSLGAVLALRLGEMKKFKKMILVSGWDFDDLTAEHQKFWKNKIDHQKIKENVGNIVVVTSDNDLYISHFQVEEMSKRLGGKLVDVKGAGHFTKETFGIDKLPEILEYFD